MLDHIEEIKKELENFQVSNGSDIEEFRLRFVSRKSLISKLFDEFKNVPDNQKRVIGPMLNELKQKAMERLKVISRGHNVLSNCSNEIDLTLPPIHNEQGSLHPVTQTKNRIIEIFERQGFNVVEGPEIDNDWNNFTALNFPQNHPAREMQDTYFIQKDPDVLLRTHTSNLQIRLMNEKTPPIRSIMPGRVYRNEAISARAHCFFHQVEALYIGNSVSFRDLKNTLFHFSKEMFGKDTEIRLRPSYFPFTEPSAEMDIRCFICRGSGCKVCKKTGWVEIAGAGMVDPMY